MDVQAIAKLVVCLGVLSFCASAHATAANESLEKTAEGAGQTTDTQTGLRATSNPRTIAEQVEYLRGLGLINARIGRDGSVRYEISRRNAQRLVSDPQLRQIYLSLQESMANESRDEIYQGDVSKEFGDK